VPALNCIEPPSCSANLILHIPLTTYCLIHIRLPIHPPPPSLHFSFSLKMATALFAEMENIQHSTRFIPKSHS
jgi:hypothetical protein